MIYKKIKALYFWIFFVLSVALVIFCFCFTKSQNTLWKIRKIWAKFQRYTISYKQEIIGTFNPQAQMILMNHQSALDIIALEELYPKKFMLDCQKRIRRNSYFQSCYEKTKTSLYR